MRIELTNHALRYTRYALIAWTLFAATYALWRVDPALFGFTDAMTSALSVGMQAAFAVACLFSAGTLGVRLFSRVGSY